MLIMVLRSNLTETEYSSIFTKKMNDAGSCNLYKFPAVFKGFPDIFGNFNGRSIFCEAKFSYGNPVVLKTEQMIFLDREHKIGAFCFVLIGTIIEEGMFHLIYKWPIENPVVLVRDDKLNSFNHLYHILINFNKFIYTNPYEVRLFDEYFHANKNYRLDRINRIASRLNSSYAIGYLSDLRVKTAFRIK